MKTSKTALGLCVLIGLTVIRVDGGTPLRLAVRRPNRFPPQR
jgi:hypothetical protein